MITGGCHCGAVRFEVSGEPLDAGHCHCQTCQRVSGAPYMTWITFNYAEVTFTNGQLARYRSSTYAERGHCASCGTSMTWHGDKWPDKIDVAAVCLDDKSIVLPTGHIWLAHKAPWVEISDGLPQHAEFEEK